MKTSPADQAFSKCVRSSVDYTCEKCGKKYDQSSTGLHCSHNFSRRHRTIRWCAENALSLCYSCHQWFGSEPYESGKWLESYLGKGVIDVLIEKKNSRIKVPKIEEKEIAKHYRNELKRMQKLRAEGQTGKIEFTSWQ